MRLTYTTDDDIDVSVSFDRWDALQHNRARWDWRIMCAGETIGAGDDLTTVGASADAVDALRSLASFLAAWDEAGESGENAALFPATMREFDVDWDSVAMDITDMLGGSEDR